jgi:hypothetical protein
VTRPGKNSERPKAVATLSPSSLTLADIVDEFGSLTFARIRTDPLPGPATEDDVVDIHAREKRL